MSARFFFRITSIFVLVMFLLTPLGAYAAPGVPNILNTQGRLMDSGGTLLGGAGTDYCFKFSLYDNATVGSGTKLWPSGAPSTMTVVVKNGVYTAGVGDTSAGGDTLDFNFQDNDTVFLNVEVASKVGATCAPGDGAESFETLEPRQRIFSSGYAINAETLSGFTASQAASGSQIPVLTGGNLVLAGSNPFLNATTTNTLTLQGGGQVSGDIQFFNSSNRITSGGHVSFAGGITAASSSITNVTSTTLAVTGTASTSQLVVSNGFTFSNVSGILKAVAGVVSAALVDLANDVTGILGIANGGTGTSTAPAYGELLIGNALGGYDLVATSSLGINSGVWGAITGTLSNQTDLQSALDARLSLALWYSTTTDGLDEGVTNLYYTDTRVNTYVGASTTIPKTYAANTFSALQAFGDLTATNATSSTLFSPSLFVLNGTVGTLSATTSAMFASTTVFGRFITGSIVSTSTATSTIRGPLAIGGLANSSYQVSILGSTTAPTSATGTAVLAVSNNNNTLSSGNNVLRLNIRTPYATACTSGTTCPRFIEYFAGVPQDADTGGRGVGSLRLSTAGTGITQTSGAADFAEYMVLNSSASVGDLVSLNAQGEYQRAVQGQSLIGVISDNPAFVGNAGLEGTTNAYIVGFAGVIETTVSAANGAINAGDFITASTTAGIGVKLLESGYALGQALEAFPGPGTGTITVLVMPKYIDASVALEEYGGGGGGVTGYWDLSTTTGVVTLASSTYSLLLTTHTTLDSASTTRISASYASSTQGFFGSLSIGALSGVLRASAGAVTTGLVNLASEVTGILGITNGGTGTSTVPAYGQVLVGNALGGYDLVATSTFGGGGGTWGSITGTLSNQTDLQNALDAKLSLSAWYGTTTDGLDEGTTNLYFTTARATSSFIGNLAATTSVTSITTLPSLSLPATQLTNFGTPFYQFFSATTTDALAEGSTNRYYQDSLVNSYIAASSTIPKTYTANTFTALQTFGNASTTQISSVYASSTQGFFGSLSIGALSGVLRASAGAVTTGLVNLASEVTGILGVGNGGTGWSEVASGAILFGNGSNALATTTAGTNGQVLALVGGVPTWVATTTYSTGLSYANGVVTNTGVTSLAGTPNQINVSGATGAVTLSLPSLLSLTNASSTAVSAYDYLAVGRTATTTIRGDGVASILPYASTTMITSETASTTNLVVSSVANSLLKTSSTGVVSAAIAGTDYITLAGLAASFPFTPTALGNATSTLIQFNAGLISSASSTIGNGTQAGGLTINGGATTTGNLFVQGSATTSALAITSLTSSLLKTNANGSVVSAIPGLDYANFAFPFTATSLGNSTSTLMQFTAGLISNASSTIGNGTQAGGLTISGGATTTGNLVVQGAATSTFTAGIQTSLLNVTSSTATSTFANGISISNGCFAINGACISAGTPVINGGGALINIQTFTADDTYTPTAGATNIMIVLTGGGGGGGGAAGVAADTTTENSAGGGGAGATAIEYLDLTGISSVSVTVGAGGGGGANTGGTGSTGATTTFGVHAEAGGGFGGVGRASANACTGTVSIGDGGEGAVALSGDMNVAGGAGMQGVCTAESVVGGTGGSSYWGGGGKGGVRINSNGTTPGSVGRAYGAGGGGAVDQDSGSATGSAGGNGASGVVIVYEYGPSDGVVNVTKGGTGTSTAPAYGQVLVGNALGGYDYVATSTFGGGGGGASFGKAFEITGGYLAPTTTQTILANGGLISQASSTFTGGFQANAATITAATTTSFFSTIASTTNLFTSNFSFGSFSGILKATAGVVSAALVDLASDVTGVLGIANGGTGTTTAPVGQLLYGGATAYQSVATSSVSVGGSLSLTGSLGALVGGTNSTISLNFGNANTWSALQQFGAGASSTAASALDYVTVGRTATTTIRGEANATSTFAGGVQALGLNITSATSTLAGLRLTNLNCSGFSNGGVLTTNATGDLICDSDDSSVGGGTFPFTPTADGNATSTRLILNAGASTTLFSALDTIYVGRTATTTIQGSISGFSTFQGFMNIAGTNGTSTFAGNLGVLGGLGIGAGGGATTTIFGSATSTFGAGIRTTLLDTSGTSTLAGIRLTNLNCSGFGNGGVLTTTSTGDIVCDSDDSSMGGGTFPFTPTADGNATSTRLILNAGASTTLFSALDTIYVGRTSTTTIQGNTTGTSTIQGFMNVTGTNSTSTFSGGLQANALNVISSSATSTFANGINLSGGCFAVGGVCVGTLQSVSNADGTLTISPTGGNVVASLNLANANVWTGLQRFTNSSSTAASALDYVAIGRTATTTIRGEANATSTFAGGVQANALNVTSSTATSTFANGINLSGGCFSINGTCVKSGSDGVEIYASTSPGTGGTWNAPVGLQYAQVIVTGSGGGGGGAAGTAGDADTQAAGGGGGAGATTIETFTAAEIGTSQTFVIGTRGTGGSNTGGNGTAGGATYFGTLIGANGGNGGLGAVTAVNALGAGGAGGAGTTTGDIGVAGGMGQGGISATEGANGGDGGTSYWGGGGAGGTSTAAATIDGRAGEAVGSGGGGGGTTDDNASPWAAGGAGASGGVFVFAYTASGADLAEWYPTEEGVVPGDIVAIGDENLEYDAFSLGLRRTSVLKKAVPGASVVGVVATLPHTVMGGEILGSAAHASPVALAGRVPVKVSKENGDIKAGDFITVSSVSGVGMRATKAGISIGKALENMVCKADLLADTLEGAQEVCEVMVLVNTSFTSGMLLKESLLGDGLSLDAVPGSVDTGRILLAKLIQDRQSIIATTTLSEISTDRLVAGLEIITPRVVSDVVVTNSLEPVEDEVEIKLFEGGRLSIVRGGSREASFEITDATTTPRELAVSIDDVGNAVFAGTLSASSLTIGSPEKPGGITMYDVGSGLSYCVRMERGALRTIDGECGATDMATAPEVPEVFVPQGSGSSGGGVVTVDEGSDESLQEGGGSEEEAGDPVTPPDTQTETPVEGEGEPLAQDTPSAPPATETPADTPVTESTPSTPVPESSPVAVNDTIQ